MTTRTAVTSRLRIASGPVQRLPASDIKKSSISSPQAAALRKISGVA